MLRGAVRSLGLLLPSSLLLACVSDVKDGSLVEPPFEDGKADVGGRVSPRGQLGFGEGSGLVAEFVEDLEFHGYTLEARPGALVTLEVTQRGSSRGLDTTLFVYGPRTETGGYGSAAIAADDDSGWGRLSRLRDLTLVVGGSYLVVIGTHDARGRGRYRVEARCGSGDCAPEAPPLASGQCEPELAAAIESCVDDAVENDPEWFYSVSRRDLVEACSDIEVVAPAYDALCASPSAPAALCALGLEGLAAERLPTCFREVWNRELDEQCVFGDRYRDVFLPGALVVLGGRTLTGATPLSATEERQVLAAVRAAAYEPVDLPEAFESVDQGEVYQTELWDASNRRGFTAYEFGAGDNSFGLVFEAGLTRAAVRIQDGDLVECTTTWGPEMRECASDDDCAEGLRCHGVAEEIRRGRCIDYRAPEHPAADSTCTASSPCPAGSGLQCAGLATSGREGICRPAWLTGRFVAFSPVAIPDDAPGGAEVQLVAYGLATVDVEVRLDLVVSHERSSDLRIVLVNPAGTEVTVWDGSAEVGPELYLDGQVVHGFSGDEQVNGIWRLRAVDTRAGRAGSISDFGLTITSRWD